MKQFKIRKLALLTALCSMSLLFTAPSFVMPVSAATPSGSETVSPQADVKRWILKVEGDEVWKRLYNTTTHEWDSLCLFNSLLLSILRGGGLSVFTIDEDLRPFFLTVIQTQSLPLVYSPCL